MTAPRTLLRDHGVEFAQLVADMTDSRGLDDASRSQLRELLAFDRVLATMSDPVQPPLLRASYCEVMHTLHVDAAPQLPLNVAEDRHSELGSKMYPAPSANNERLHVVALEVRRMGCVRVCVYLCVRVHVRVRVYVSA